MTALRLSISMLLLAATPSYAGVQGGKIRFNRDIRPILSDKCFYCHGPDKNHREADLRLDIREEAIKAEAIVPGDPSKGSLVDRIFTHDEDDVMPPPESKKTLDEGQRQTLKAWIAQGAEYEPHWAYTPLLRPATPKPDSGAGSVRNPVDAFIVAALAERKIQPSPEADRRTLIRRLSLDLVGLPPSPEDVAAFVQDQDPKAYEHLVERLLRSPHFGERWAVWWLDVARFSDTVGYHGDQNQRVFPYRDYVINAFNQNKRFSQFTLEQIAGDLLPNPTTEQLIATGFNRLNMMTREGGAQPKEYVAKYQADRVRTIGGAWLGATLGCAECHDHKFDPFTQRDFYSLSAYFADVKQFGVYANYGYTPNPELEGWSNDHPFPPEIEVNSPYLKQRLQGIEKRMADVALAVVSDPKLAASFASWREEAQAFVKQYPDGWLTLAPAVDSKSVDPPLARAKSKAATKSKDGKPLPAAEFRVESDGSVLFGPKGAQTSTFTFTPGGGRITAVKIELLATAAHQNSVVRGGGEASMILAPSFAVRSAGQSREMAQSVLFADATSKEPRYAGTVEEPGVTKGWKTRKSDSDKAQSSFWILERPAVLGKGEVFIVRIPNHTLGCVRVSVTSVAPSMPLRQNLSDQLADDGLAAQMWLSQARFDDPRYAGWRRGFDEKLECRDGKAWTQVTVATKEPLTIHLLPRGNWQDESGPVMQPESPHFLPHLPGVDGRRQSRIDLARWLTSNENPLTPRAVVNRLWKQFFGSGLSSVVDDLGAQGELPSHPELLDWLATEFRDSGWDFKHMVRTLVLSATYRQDSKARPDLKDVDPQNRLLAFQNPRRLDAEFVRDNALFAAGILNLDIGGPSVKPYQPANYYENLQFPNRDYVADRDDRQWRRGVYMHWQRTFLHPMLANFDAPMRDECTCARNVSNTPQQALTLLNDPTFVEAARVMAANVLRCLDGSSDDSRLNDLFQRTLGRDPLPAETKSLQAFLGSQRDAYRTSKEDAAKLVAVGLKPIAEIQDQAELAAWTSVCRVILNLHETITRY